ncbi:hypothetical protein BJ170DRAFT_289834 [Xylariales sp. AK1849]|nr:hypothetical protein BJ170DRAFT_289834 [Xylariales sp. AK1849]
MRKVDQRSDEELEALEDKTEALTLRSKRTERAEKKQRLRAKKPKPRKLHLLDLPYELILEVLSLLQPSSIFSLCRVDKSYQLFIAQEETRIVKSLCSWRYACLQKCFHAPVLLEKVDPDVYPSLQSMERIELRNAVKKPFQHIQPPDPALICTCFTCLLRWNSLCIIPDFAFWQDNLDAGTPIPMIPRGRYPEWNQNLVDTNANIVRKALLSPLWHARLLEEHLRSTTRAISRHAANKGNRRKRYRMSKEDIESGTDLFLERSGPPTTDIPFIRDNYYMLEAFVPNRSWKSEEERWMYMPAEQHDTDVRIAVSFAKWRALQAAQATPSIQTAQTNRQIVG